MKRWLSTPLALGALAALAFGIASLLNPPPAEIETRAAGTLAPIEEPSRAARAPVAERIDLEDTLDNATSDPAGQAAVTGTPESEARSPDRETAPADRGPLSDRERMRADYERFGWRSFTTFRRSRA